MVLVSVTPVDRKAVEAGRTCVHQCHTVGQSLDCSKIQECTNNRLYARLWTSIVAPKTQVSRKKVMR